MWQIEAVGMRLSPGRSRISRFGDQLMDQLRQDLTALRDTTEPDGVLTDRAG